MSPSFLGVAYAMLITGVLLAPAAADALTDFQGLQTIINTAAGTIGATTNSTRWGFAGPASGTLGTANTIENITTTILRTKFNLDTNKVTWLNASNATNIGPKLTSLDDPYINYVGAVPNLSTALTTLGRAWHSEMNKPVYEAIDSLQQALTALQSSLLTEQLIHTNSTLRTIRASGSLEDAQVAWGRFLNFPGASPSSSKRAIAADALRLGGPWAPTTLRRSVSAPSATAVVKLFFDDELNHKKESPKTRRSLHIAKEGSFYTHKELWGRAAHRRSVDLDEKLEPVQKKSTRFSHLARIGRPFIA
ncbi:hypothetical protein EJ04DRAFT_310504 [Polyplosphaeria fusca]|uniref:Uncharacterized protein n=1 Tax=Polyplosphaeria fusca TaxID=682080 RepID=A0A9P4V624_9PLEO|nr:hypothetical protein EJ04DRAFT_310504 [Polyplosphaeria fusca]